MKSQKAPSTRRCIKTGTSRLKGSLVFLVRKHPAPEGALRRLWETLHAATSVRQKAPSTRRCIKTCPAGQDQRRGPSSESTQHQKVH